MAKTDVKLYSIDNYGKATTATISDVNPEATSSQLVQMGHLFNNLTQNTYSKTDRINTINCDTESGSGKQTPTLQFIVDNNPVTPESDIGIDGNRFSTNVFSIQYDGDGQVLVETVEGNAELFHSIGNSFDSSTHRAAFDFYLKAASNGQYVHFKICATETDTFKAVETGTYYFVASNM